MTPAVCFLFVCFFSVLSDLTLHLLQGPPAHKRMWVSNWGVANSFISLNVVRPRPTFLSGWTSMTCHVLTTTRCVCVRGGGRVLPVVGRQLVFAPDSRWDEPLHLIRVVPAVNPQQQNVTSHLQQRAQAETQQSPCTWARGWIFAHPRISSKPWCSQKMQGVVVVGGGAGMPSEYCHGTIEQGTEAHELPTHPVTCLRPYPAKAGSSTLLVTPPTPPPKGQSS